MIALIVVERPNSISSEQGDNLAFADRERDSVQDMTLAVISLETRHFEQRRTHQEPACPK